MDCNAAFPKAPRSDCKALLEELRPLPDNDYDFCASLCFDQALNASHSQGVMEQKGACRVSMITNSITGNFTDNSHRCGAMYVNHFPYGPVCQLGHCPALHPSTKSQSCVYWLLKQSLCCAIDAYHQSKSKRSCRRPSKDAIHVPRVVVMRWPHLDSLSISRVLASCFASAKARTIQTTLIAALVIFLNHVERYLFSN
jgi:hypothetical protein